MNGNKNITENIIRNSFSLIKKDKKNKPYQRFMS